MEFNFNLKDTNIFLSLKRERNFLLRFSKTLRDIFLTLFLVALILIFFSFLNFASGYLSLKVLTLFLSLSLFFLNLDLFTRFKVKNPEPSPYLMDAVLNPTNYNLAEFLDFDSAKIVSSAINFCQRKKIKINSTSLFYSAIKFGKNAGVVCFRLGLDPKKLQIDIKNYLEKIPKQNSDKNQFSEEFQKTIEFALKLTVKRNKKSIGEEEILASLAIHDEFFKKILIDYELKPTDVENLTNWLYSAETLMENKRKFWTYENLLRLGSFGKDFSAGYTITLDKFSIDWRRVVSKWNFKEIIGHEKEIEEVEVILAKPKMANVLLVGNPGSGRNSIVEAIAQKCYLGKSLPNLNNKRVVQLDMVFLIAQIDNFEELELIIDRIFSEVVMAGNVILVIDNLENFIGQKIQKAGTFDISGVLSKYLLIPQFRFIGITSYEGLHKHIEKESTLFNLLEKVEVSEVTEEETLNILQSAALELEYANKVFILYPSIREIVNLTARYMPSLPFPKKALDILEEAVIYVKKIKGAKRYPIVLPHHIAEIISQKTNIPVGKMEVREKEVLLNLENLIHERIINQEEAVKEISVAMRRARTGIGSKKRPMGTFLFMGPTGVGKTETAKALAQIYFGSEDKIIRLDMSEFQAISDISRLIGAISPVEIEGLLTTPVRESPFSLILLDEIEKAHPNILNLFLQVLDEGHLTDGQGRKVIFTNTIIIATSNAGAETIFEWVSLGKPLNKAELLDILFKKNIFKPEFINRFDATIIFQPLTKDNLMEIAKLFLVDLQKKLKEKGIDFQITESLKEKIVELSYKPEFGAREMRRVFQDKVENAVAAALLSDKIKKGDKFEINPENFELIVNPPQT